MKKNNELEINTYQISLLVVVILISFFSLYTLINVRKELKTKDKNANFSSELNGVIIAVSTLIVFIFYWLLAYKQLKDEENPIHKRQTKINLFARTLILVAISIDVIQAYNRYSVRNLI